MNKKLRVLYSSKYGHTKKYAELIAQKFNVRAEDIENIDLKSLNESDIILYGSSLYAGKINKSKEISNFNDKKLIVFTVGLADYNEIDYEGVIDQNFSTEAKEKIKFFHLMGGIDYSTMSSIHKMMMWVMTKFLIKKQLKENPTPELISLKDSYGKSLEFFDKENLEELIKYLEEIM
jgi:menaquinone-dependent protoporphyrinogen IX oxidase